MTRAYIAVALGLSALASSARPQAITGIPNLASPPPIGNVSPGPITATSLSVTTSIGGAGIAALQASPGPIGVTTPSSGAFTTLSASSTVAGAGFSNYLASPPPIGSTTPAAGAFASLTDAGITGSTQCVQVNSLGVLSGSGGVCGGSGLPGGVSGQIQYNNSGAFGGIAVTGSGSVVEATSPTLTTPVLGAATATSLNGLTVTSSTGTLTVANAKTATFSNSVTYAGTDGTTMTFPATSSTLAGLATAQTWTGTNTFGTLNIGSSNRFFQLNGNSLFGYSGANPSCVATGGSPTCVLTANNGTAAFEFTLGAAGSVTTITITPGLTASHGFVCDGFDGTTTTERLKQTATTATSATLTFYNDAGAPTSPGASDLIWAKCLAL